MRKIEKLMIEAVNGKKCFKLSNTEVIPCKNGSVFVKLYDTIIFACVNGEKYFCDGGYKTSTTASRLRALGADYSVNAKKNNCVLTPCKVISNLFIDSSFNF